MKTLLAAATALTALAGTASATTIDFNVGRGWSKSGLTYGDATVYGGTVDTNGKILSNDEWTTSWSGSAGGLGIVSSNSVSYNSDESGGADQHTIDGKNNSDMALIDFGGLLVQIESVTFAYWDSSDDFDYAVYDSIAVGSTASTWAEDVDSGDNPSVKTFTFAAGDLVGSIFGFGADHSSDEFKLQSISYSEISTVPLPASSLLLLGGLGGFAALRRRKKA